MREFPGWLKSFSRTLDLNIDELLDENGPFAQPNPAKKHPVLVWCSNSQEIRPQAEVPVSTASQTESEIIPLYSPLIEAATIPVNEDEETVRRIWRVTEPTLFIPPGVIGQMTHKALELWLDHDDPRLIPLLESLALDAGLATEDQRIEAVRRVRELIERFCAHPLRGEIEAADERHHEVPFTRMRGGRSETGYIDLLYRKGEEWFVVDFKTDRIQSEDQYRLLVKQYSTQLARYGEVTQQLLGRQAELSLCFLDHKGRVHFENSL